MIVGGEAELLLLLHLFPEGVEELDGAFAVYADEPPIGFDVLEAADVEDGWEDAWRTFHHGVIVGRLWVGPPWELPKAVPVFPPGVGGLAANASSDWEEAPSGALPVVIDPGRAFGTGAHPTTRLCLGLLQDGEPTSLVDIGCGSGVLSIAAAKLGYAPVSALDIDDVALEVTAANAAANGVAIEIVAEPPRAELAVMNIALDVVERVLPALRAERAITSGYLERDAPRVAGWHSVERRVRDGWAADLLEFRP